jgi:hypothetical protein
MKTIIKGDTDQSSVDICFTNEGLDHDGFVNICIGETEYTVSLHELVPAVIAFDMIRSKRLSEEEQMS